ncbi:MAG: hypothetical protein IJF08_05270 [Clostridia bacterium]|nr:hypothetical protein [Clostridia bacterium]
MANEAKLNQQYTELLHRFEGTSTWREFLELAKQFRELDTFKDASTYYTRCVRAASAGAYREYREEFTSRPDLSSDDYFEAAAVLSQISDYMDAREWARTYKAKATALCYAEAIALYEQSEGRWQNMREAYYKMNRIKGYKDSRDLVERYQKHYAECAYAAANEIYEKAQTGPEYIEAAEIFEQIPEYSDSATLAQKARKAASKYKSSAPKKPKKPVGGDVSDAPKSSSVGGDVLDAPPQIARKKRAKAEDSVSGVDFGEIWQTINKKRLIFGLVGMVICGVGLWGSAFFAAHNIDPSNDFLVLHGDKIRGISVLMVIGGAVFAIIEFFRMLSPSLKRKLALKVLEVGKRVAKPVLKALDRVLGFVGIQIGKQRLKGKDEKSFVYVEKPQKAKKNKKLRNEGKWHELSDNASRVRFIFVDYMIRKIKQGYRMKYHQTPLEIGREIAVEDDEKQLFEVYQTARYAGLAANEVIDNDLVDRLVQINLKKTQ